ncbi:MAG: hypothetical protein SFY32_10675 [Bacteroidota bacterium]|nr:hypothetical protein [Bacteroidota bacterium]
MKRILRFLILLLLLVGVAIAQQVPGGFNYQSIVRDAIGLPVVNSNVNLRISIIQGNVAGPTVYQETQNAITNQFGLVNLVIGKGTSTNVTSITGITSINWSSADYFIQVEVNVAGSWVSLGITQFQSVPYSLLSGNTLRLQGYPVSPNTPSLNQLLLFDGTQWYPGNIAGANGGTMVSVSGLGPITILGTATLDPQIAILQSSATSDGYLSSNDWGIFNSKLGTGTGFLGNIAGTYDAITVTGIQGVSVSSTTPTNGQVLQYNLGINQWVPSPFPANVWTTTGNDIYNLNTGNTGIGTSSANEKLTVFGNISATGTGFFSNAVLSGNAQMASANVSGTSTLSNTRTTNLTISGIGTGFLTVDGVGNVGSVASATNLSTSSAGVNISGSNINIATQDGIIAAPGLLSAVDYNNFVNKINNTTSPGTADIAGNYANGFTVVGIGNRTLAINSIIAGQVLSFNGTNFVPGTVPVYTSQITSIVGINGATVSGTDLTGFTIDGQNLAAGSNITITGNTINANAPTPLTSITGVGVTVSGGNNSYTITGSVFTSQITSIVGINGATVSGTDLTGFTIDGQNLTAGSNITITGNTINAPSPTGLTSIIGVGSVSVSGSNNDFTITGPVFASQITSITGINGATVTGTDLTGYTIDGQNLTAGSNVTITGGIINASAPTALTSLTGIGVSISGTNNDFTITGPVMATYTGDNITTTLTGTFPNFTISGISQGSNFASLTGVNVTITGPRGTPTITGYNYVAGAGIALTSTGTDITIINSASLVGDGITTSVVGLNSNYTVFGINGTNNQWTTSGNNIYYNKGYVGIGNSNPLVQLHINSSATGVASFITSANSDNSMFANLYSGRVGYTFPGIGFSANSGGFGFGTLTSPSNEASYVNLMLLSNTGNLGIGTMIPNQRLTVEGNASVTGNIFANNNVIINAGLSAQNVSVTSGIFTNNLSVTGIAALDATFLQKVTFAGLNAGFLTVDGFGNLTTTSLNILNSQWITTGTGVFYPAQVGINGYDASVGSVQLGIIAPPGTTPINIQNGSGVNIFNFAASGTERTINLYKNTGDIDVQIHGGLGSLPTYFNAPGNFGIGTTTPGQKFTVQGNSSISGISYFGSIIGNNLIGAPAGSVLTVDGTTGLIGYSIPSIGTQQWQNATSSSLFTNSFVGIGTNTLTGGNTKLKVQGDISGGGMVLASQSFVNELSTDQTTLLEIIRVPVYIPEGTNTLRGTMIAYLSSIGSGEIDFFIAGAISTPLVITNTASALSSEILVNTNNLSGWQELVIRARRSVNPGTITVRAFSISIKD